MSVLTKNGEIYADIPGAIVARILAALRFVRDVVADTMELRREMIEKHGLSAE